ncbi:MAG: DNA gyrase inhibitor YacG [Candidatus Dadabacteria bacterium]|nr:DNA gyrase inhibitor YacG [Candidatus Dadabacteria bacterium]MCZ6639730.1 DNA gyrase inhibitor YacG [Candidatus Dadabacteria bacterium]
MSIKVKCPNCKKEVLWDNNKYRPFCSERCKMIDLGTWAKEGYRVSEHGTLEKNDDEELMV